MNRPSDTCVASIPLDNVLAPEVLADPQEAVEWEAAPHDHPNLFQLKRGATPTEIVHGYRPLLPELGKPSDTRELTMREMEGASGTDYGSWFAG